MDGVSVGHIVHFHPPTADESTDEPQAALITKVHGKDGTVNLSVFPDGAARQSYTSVPYSKEPKPYSWHWPAKA